MISLNRNVTFTFPFLFASISCLHTLLTPSNWSVLTFLLWLTWYLGIWIITAWISCTPSSHQASTKLCLFWLHLHSEAASVSCEDIANKPMIGCMEMALSMEIASPASMWSTTELWKWRNYIIFQSVSQANTVNMNTLPLCTEIHFMCYI